MFRSGHIVRAVPAQPPPIYRPHKIVTQPIFSIASAPAIRWTPEDFNKNIDDIKEVVVDQSSSNVKAVTVDGESHDVAVRITPSIIDSLLEHGAVVKYDNPVKNLQQLFYYIEIVLMIVFMGYIGYSLVNRNSRSTFEPMLHSKAKEIKEISITFDNVAGIDYAKRELQEIVDFLKNPDKYTKVGAKIPKGCLLVSPPGCGKTLLARAVAGTAGVPFFSASASEFIELFVGVGSGRIRDLFQKAKAKSPCIVFIDEIDAIGKSRSSGFGPGNDEREQTINQLLTEMDGFETNTGIVVIGATNRVDVLDKALLRPGRFDRIVYIDAPDLSGRVDILNVHCKDKPIDKSVTLSSIAKVTAGFSGADLNNLTNEAAIVAARNNNDTITKADFEEALDRVTIGLTKTSKAMSEENKYVVAVHESGHVLTAFFIDGYDDIRKVSILPRGNAGGVTVFEPSMDRVDSGLFTRSYLEDKLVVALGGRAAEEIVFGSFATTTGASQDMEQVYKIARLMVTRYGFSDELGTVAWDVEGASLSDVTQRKIDKEITKLVSRAYTRAKNLIESHKDALRRLAIKLIDAQTLDAAEIKSVITGV